MEDCHNSKIDASFKEVIIWLLEFYIFCYNKQYHLRDPFSSLQMIGSSWIMSEADVEYNGYEHDPD